MYTKCPACNTLFRITEQQLAAARGKVRCGKCDHIYNAQGTLIDTLPTTASAAKKPAAPPAAPKAATPPPAPKPALAPTPAPTSASRTTLIDNDELMKIIESENIKVSSPSSQPARAKSTPAPQARQAAPEPAPAPKPTPTPSSTPGLSDFGLPDDLDDEEWQSIDLGSSNPADDDDWLDDDDSFDDIDEPVVDISSNEFDDDDWFDDDDEQDNVAAFDESTDDDDENELLRHVSKYMDDDAAEELASEGNASSILSEVNQQLSFAIDEPVAGKTQSINNPDSPGNWLDDMHKPSKASATSIKLNADEEKELNDAILSSLEHAYPDIDDFDDDDDDDVFAEPAPAPRFEAAPVTPPPLAPSPAAKKGIVLESNASNGHLIGQHDKKKSTEEDSIPFRLRNSIGISAEKPRTILKWLLLIVVTMALVAALAAQAVLFRSFELANQYPDLAPWLTEACQQLPCRNSTRKDIEQIQLLSRNVSQHPKDKAALLIKAAIQNQASFAQSYPDIKISLSDLTGNTVAERIFKPSEYLGRLYHPYLQMKPGKPVHIALEVLDPGNAAINFEFQFL